MISSPAKNIKIEIDASETILGLVLTLPTVVLGETGRGGLYVYCGGITRGDWLCPIGSDRSKDRDTCQL